MRTFAGMVVAAAVAASCASAGTERTRLAIRPFASGLSSPVFVASIPGQTAKLYVVEQVGRIAVFVNGKASAKPFLDIRSKVRAGGEQGLLSVAFHPKYKANHKFYVNYTDTNGDTRVVEYKSNGVVALRAVRQVLFVKQPYSNHNGGQVQFGPDGWLYVGMGDGGAGGDPGNRAQSLKSRLGKLLKINVNSKKPIVQIAGYGLRNPWRFSFDKQTGDLYIGDVGQNEYEEVNYTPKGSPGLENYGWRVYEGTHVYAPGEKPNPSGSLVIPVAEYSHGSGCSVTGGYVYRGSRIESLKGRYVYGDFCSGKIWSLAMQGGKADVRTEAITVKNLSSFGVDTSGELYATSLDGTVYAVTA